jgi:hypothetical protein
MNIKGKLIIILILLCIFIILIIYLIIYPKGKNNDCIPSCLKNEKCINKKCKPINPNPPPPSNIGHLPILIKSSDNLNDMMFPFIPVKYNTIENFINNITDASGKGQVCDKFIKYFKSTFPESDLLLYICDIANNMTYSPSVNDMKIQLKNNQEIYLTLQQVAYIIANLLLGKNTIQNNLVINTKVGSNGLSLYGYNDYKSGKAPHNCLICDESGSGFQLCAYFTAMNFWRQTKDLNKILVGYTYIIGETLLPPEEPLGTTTVVYKCINSLTDNQVASLRLIDGGASVGGSYFNSLAQYGTAGQEEYAFKLYPELAVGMFLLPQIESGKSIGKIKGWLVFGARIYNETLPPNNIVVKGLGKGIDNTNFWNLEQNYKIFPSGILGLSANPCNSGINCDITSKDCNKCWTNIVHPNDLSLLYSRVAPCLNINQWPKCLKQLAIDWNISETWPYLGGQLGSGDWNCNPTFSTTLQGLAACNGNWKNVNICLGNSESNGVCVCKTNGLWNKKIYKKLLLGLKKNQIDYNIWSNCQK